MAPRKPARAKANPSSTANPVVPEADEGRSTTDGPTNNNPTTQGNVKAMSNAPALNEEAFVVDFENVKEPEPVADGRYNAVIAGAKQGMSKNNLPKVTVTFRIEDEGDYKGRQLIETLSLAPTALWKSKAWFVAMGVPKDYKGPITGDLILGERCVINVRMEEESSGIDPNTNEPYPKRPRVRNVLPYGSQVGIDGLLD